MAVGLTPRPATISAISSLRHFGRSSLSIYTRVQGLYVALYFTTGRIGRPARPGRRSPTANVYPACNDGLVPLRSAKELSSVSDPAWPEVAAAAEQSGAITLPHDPAAGLDVLFRLQVTARSTLGAMALNCGGILADHGWFRLYGGGGGLLPDVATASNLVAPPSLAAPPGMLVVGSDAIGGRFAIDGGALGVGAGEICYWGPDTLTWDGLGGGHSAFVRAALDGSLGAAFASLRWHGWEAEVGALAPNQGIVLYPPPFTAEGADPNSVRRSTVPWTELRAFYDDAARQLNASKALP